MSHLSILPTLYTRLDLLESSLRDEGFDVSISALMDRFDQEPMVVDLLASLGSGPPLGWVLGADQGFRMVGDLQRISQHHGLDARLQRVARRYALREALDAAEQFPSTVHVMIEPS